MKDNRRYKRFTLDVMEVNGDMIRATDVKIIDISLGGISIKADRRLNIGTKYPLKLADKTKVLPLDGTVMWSSLAEVRQMESGESVPIYQAGIKFSELAEEDAAELENFIKRNMVSELLMPQDRRTEIRFRIRSQDEAILELSENFTVRQINLGGMLIESEHSLEIDSKMPMELFPQDGGLIRFLGRVTTCMLLDPNRYAIGIEILDMSEEDREVFTNLVDKCEALDIGDSGGKEATESADYQSSPVPREVVERIDYLYAWHENMSYYKMLGVKDHASETEIKDAYQRMVQEFHPDKYFSCSSEIKEKVNVIFTHLNTAYSTLKDPEKKKKYDANYNLGGTFFLPEDEM